MPGKCMGVLSQSCPTLWDFMDCSLPGSAVRGIFQARGLEWGATAFSFLDRTVLISEGRYRNTGSFGKQRGFTFTSYFHALEKEMATHSSILAWRIPGTAEPGGLPSMGSHRVGHD